MGQLNTEEWMFFELENVTECREQTRPVIKIPQHGFSDKGVRYSAFFRSFSAAAKHTLSYVKDVLFEITRCILDALIIFLQKEKRYRDL